MKIILKAALYVIAVLFLSISIGSEADSKIESTKPSSPLLKSRINVKSAPYGISGKAKISNPIYVEKITLSSSLESHR